MLTHKCINVLTTVAKEVMHTYLGSHQGESSAHHQKLLSTNQIEVFYLNKMAALNF